MKLLVIKYQIINVIIAKRKAHNIKYSEEINISEEENGRVAYACSARILSASRLNAPITGSPVSAAIAVNRQCRKRSSGPGVSST